MEHASERQILLPSLRILGLLCFSHYGHVTGRETFISILTGRHPSHLVLELFSQTIMNLACRLCRSVQSLPLTVALGVSAQIPDPDYPDQGFLTMVRLTSMLV